MSKVSSSKEKSFYFPHSEKLTECVRLVNGPDGSVHARMPARLFFYLLRNYLENNNFSEENYLQLNEDVKEAVESGEIDSGLEHFVEHGLFENRGVKVDFDEDYYCKEYGDVKKGIEAGAIESAEQHFLDFGYKEGRVPSRSVKLIVEDWNSITG